MQGTELLWGKSFGGRHHLLAHLLDTAAVSECVFDRFLTPAAQRLLASHLGGLEVARQTLMWLGGVHDIGKCTPAFQSKNRELGAAVRATELSWVDGDVPKGEWPHGTAGGHATLKWLESAGVSAPAALWMSSVVAGHHGVVCDLGVQQPRRTPRGHGKSPVWAEARDFLFARVTEAVGFEPDALPNLPPPPGVQALVSGLVIMADWIASASDQFPPLSDLAAVSWPTARERATRGWTALDLGSAEPLGTASSPVAALDHRFGITAWPFQREVVRVAAELDGAGIIVVEAPMGEGKTEAALAAAEVISHRQGRGGIFVGLPTQATADPMFVRVVDWISTVGPGEHDVRLAHGKASFNPRWQQLLRRRPTSINDDDERRSHEVAAAAQWFLGHKRPLLAPTVVGTVDHLLLAGARIRHVVLRHAGLANKVVIVDEVHAADVYMSVFLQYALWWLGSAGVPVILLSATLPPSQRRSLLSYYLRGALQQMPSEEPLALDDGSSGAYPLVTVADVRDRVPAVRALEPASGRMAVDVAITVIHEVDGDDQLRRVLRERLADGGCAVVVRNTVSRAQRTARTLREDFGDDVLLLHARYTVGDRAKRNQQLLDELGPRGRRPSRRVVVATQVVEQSLDIDADLLVTDLAPIDLVLQRVGRMHRHLRTGRPERLRRPELIVTGMAPGAEVADLPRGSVYVYGQALLLKTALVIEESSTWRLPAAIPDLVSQVYEVGRSWPPAVVAASAEADRRNSERLSVARSVALDPTLTYSTGATLHGLHRLATGEGDEATRIVVRDGHASREVVLVRARGAKWSCLDGAPLDVSVEPGAEVTGALMGDVVRLPYESESVKSQLHVAPDAWAAHPWLSDRDFLVLDPAAGSATYGDDGLVLS